MSVSHWTDNPLQLLSQALQVEILQAISDAGFLPSALSQQACEELQLDFEQWMVLILPLAAGYAHAPVSNFKVGAIAAGQDHNNEAAENRFATLYFGCNYEFLDRPLNYSLHAEQAALSNAWMHGETKIELMAISAAPCGHCRQFLHEMANGRLLSLIFPDFSQAILTQSSFATSAIKLNKTSLNLLLPDAFGPSDLGNTQSLMAQQFHSGESIKSPDLSVMTRKQWVELVSACTSSYAPYSDNLAACGIILKDGRLIIGRYAENAAYNPCLYPLPAALSQLNWMQPGDIDNIENIVLVERSSKVSQRSHAKNIIESLGLTIKLKCYQLNDFIDALI